MKTILMSNVVVLSLGLLMGTAKAQSGQESQFCRYGNTIPVAKYYFQEIEPSPDENSRFRKYEARLPDNIKVIAGKTHQGGYGATYEMILNYNQGEVVMEDMYQDYETFRRLRISAKFNGERVDCQF